MKTRSGRLLARRGLALCSVVMTALLLMLPGSGATAVAQQLTFAPGDVFVSTEQQGTVQWRSPDGTLIGVLVPTVAGSSEGMRFDAAGTLYVSHWCGDPTYATGTLACATGNTVETFNRSGVSQGTFGSGYNCNPTSLAFDATGNAYVGQAACSGAVLKFPVGSQLPIAYFVAAERSGSFKVELAADGCTLFYTSWGPNVKRFDVCANAQLADFNVTPMPGGEATALRLLPDGGVLVASGAVIARLDASGALVQTYSLGADEYQYWFGVDLVGDGTFWAINSYSSTVATSLSNYLSGLLQKPNVYRFDLATGAVVTKFYTGTAVKDVIVSR